MCKTLVFYINSIHDGGAERVIIQIAHHFAEAGYKSILVTSYRDDHEYPVPNDVIRLSLEEEKRNTSKIIRNVTRIEKLRKICICEKADAVVSFMAEANIRSIIATAFLKCKTIVSVRNDPNREYKGIIGKIMGKILIPRADGCVFQTQEAMKWFPVSFQKKTEVILNDVDKTFFNTQYAGGKDIVALGRLVKQKNHRLLIDAFARIKDSFPDVNLKIYGIGPLESEIKDYIDRNQLQNRVFLEGLTKDAAHVLAEARLFVLSSDYEGLPNALMEALAIGVPSVATDCPCGGPKSLITHGENGILVPVGNIDFLSDAISLLLNDDELAHRMSQKARMMAQEYETGKVFSKWKRYVERIIAEQPLEKS